MLDLHAYAPALGEPSGSPFCVKVMALLRMSGAEWRTVVVNDPRKAPKGKLPVLVDGDRTIADSHAIRHYLEERLGVDFDAPLDALQRAQSTALQRMIEEHLYWALLWDRWADDTNWASVREIYFGHIPALMRGLVAGMVRKGSLAQARAQGMGRHSFEEIAGRADEDFAAIETLLGERPFLFGTEPTAIDATAGPFLNGTLASDHETLLQRKLKDRPALVAYAARTREALYPQPGAG